jgi:riboflavin kinase/FMN adenylyltransferase
MTLEERLEALAALQIDTALVVRFTPEFSRLLPREFYVRYIIEGIGAREVVEGHDHTFGRDREAGVTMLVELGREFGVNTTAVHPVLIGGERVGSSAIRRALGEGEIGKATGFLGRMYELGGTVVRGDARGAGLGFPTANVRPASGQKVVPMNGVYAVRVEWKGKMLDGMLNIGVRPTVTDGSTRTIEAHLFDFGETIYGDDVRILFAERVRDERKFTSKEELITQLGSDRDRCREILASMPALMNQS